MRLAPAHEFECPPHCAWFYEARFGLFIHWGIYSAAARHEWVKHRECISDAAYQRYFDYFDPDLYEPSQWARNAREAGMKYAVITTKHHEGFCLWDSDLTEYKVTRTPYGRDLLRPFVEAFRSEGLRIGFYHSLIDWHHPDYPVDGLHPQRDNLAYREVNAARDISKYQRYLHSQVEELLTRYGTIDVLWFDFSYSQRDWGWSRGKGREDWRSEELVALVRKLQPSIILNDRLEVGGDLVTPEQYQPSAWITVADKPVLWEACQTLNGSWGYDRDNLDWKSPVMLLQMLIDSVSKGGNLLLNVGPNARGEFDQRSMDRLQAIGGWLRLHGRSIYGCSASSFVPPPDCRYTQRGNRLYLHLLRWPFGHVMLPGLSGRIAYAQLLNDASEIVVNQNHEPHPHDPHIQVPAEGDAMLILPVQAPLVLVPVIEMFLNERV